MQRGETEATVHCPDTSKPVRRILVHAVEPNREMYGLDVVSHPACAEHRPTVDPDTPTYRDGIQVADRRLEAAAVIDRHAQHSGDRTGEADDAVMRTTNCGAARCLEVNAPMPRVGPGGREARSDRTIDGLSEADARRGRDEHAADQGYRHGSRKQHHTPLRRRRSANVPHASDTKKRVERLRSRPSLRPSPGR